MKTKVLNSWIKHLNEHNLEKILDMYHTSAILLPTLSSKIRRGKDEIRDYFVHFLAKDQLTAELKEVYIQSIYSNKIKIDSGIYVFSWLNEQKQKESLEARFTFVIENGLILEHHSSIQPL